MSVSEDLRLTVSDVWDRVVNHKFVTELGLGTLPSHIFNDYFDQDYLFLKDWAILLGMAAVKSPDFDSSRQVVGFLHLGLGGEEGLFQKAFKERGLDQSLISGLKYLPDTFSYSGYLRTCAYEGSFIDVIVTLLAVEWPYLSWAERLFNAGMRPDNYYYKTWIDIHVSDGMYCFVNWMIQTVDNHIFTDLELQRAEQIFANVLRYEEIFFDMCYKDET